MSLLPPDVPSGQTETYHPFPPPSVLAAPEVSKTLRSLGFGYRAEFIQKTAQMLVERHGSFDLRTSSPEPAEVWLKTLREMPTAEARAELLKLMGVGRKVADCVLLMSLDKVDILISQMFMTELPSTARRCPSRYTRTPNSYQALRTVCI